MKIDISLLRGLAALLICRGRENLQFQHAKHEKEAQMLRTREVHYIIENLCYRAQINQQALDKNPLMQKVEQLDPMLMLSHHHSTPRILTTSRN